MILRFVLLLSAVLAAPIASARPYQTLLPEITGPGVANDGFGARVAVHGDWMIATASGDRVLANGYQTNGSLLVFERVGLAWVQRQRLRPPAAGALAWGYDIAIANGWIAVSAPQEVLSASRSGRVFLFRLQGGTWLEAGVLDAPVDGTYVYGLSLALDGDTLAIVDGSGGGTVASRPIDVFLRSGVTWSRATRIAAFGGTGLSKVALSGPHIAISAERRVEIWRRAGTTSTWALDGFLTPDQSSNAFATSVAIEGDRLLATDPLDPAFGTDAGAVHVFERDAGGWARRTKLGLTGVLPNLRLGQVVAMSGDDVYATAGIEVPIDDVPRGYVAHFRRGAGTWTTLPAISDPEIPRLQAEFGYAIAAAPATFVSGASWRTTGAGGYTGRVYAYDAADTGVPVTLDRGVGAAEPETFSSFGEFAAVRANSVYQPDVGAGTVSLFRHGSDGWAAYRQVALPSMYFAFGRWAICGRQLVMPALDGGLRYRSFDVDGNPATAAFLPSATQPGVPGTFGANLACTDSHLAVRGDGFPRSILFYRWTGSAWEHVQSFADPSNSPNPAFADGISVSGDRAVVGAADIAFAYHYNGSTWVEDGQITCASCAALTPRVALDGDRLAIPHGSAVTTWLRNAGGWSLEASSAAILPLEPNVRIGNGRLLHWSGQSGAGATPLGELRLVAGAWVAGRTHVDTDGAPLKIVDAGFRGPEAVVFGAITADPRTDNPGAPALYIDDPDVLLRDGFEGF